MTKRQKKISHSYKPCCSSRRELKITSILKFGELEPVSLLVFAMNSRLGSTFWTRIDSIAITLSKIKLSLFCFLFRNWKKNYWRSGLRASSRQISGEHAIIQISGKVSPRTLWSAVITQNIFFLNRVLGAVFGDISEYF